MVTDQRWRWAGIVSVISIGGVLLTDIVANIVGGYISEQIKTWQVPGGQPKPKANAPSEAEAMVANVSDEESQPAMATVATKTKSAREPSAETLATGDQPPVAEQPEAAEAPLPPAGALPAPPLQPLVLNGPVEKVIDTGTLKIAGETVLLAGVKGLGSPYRDQLAKFIEEQGSEVRCTPNGARHTCFVSNVDLALAALTNGAARLAPDATEQYRAAAADARRNHRGIFQ
jgi:endonuclease YncB( thermonuclease family)